MLSIKSWSWSMMIPLLLFLMTVTPLVNLKLLNLSPWIHYLASFVWKVMWFGSSSGFSSTCMLVWAWSYISQIVNQSLQFAVVPEQLKVAMVKPLLKKPSLDYREFKNFRPIYNLQFLGKIIEKFVADQLINYLDDNNLQEVYQSAYKRRHVKCRNCS